MGEYINKMESNGMSYDIFWFIQGLLLVLKAVGASDLSWIITFSPMLFVTGFAMFLIVCAAISGVEK